MKRIGEEIVFFFLVVVISAFIGFLWWPLHLSRIIALIPIVYIVAKVFWGNNRN
jgi:hypothetical protein